MTRYHIIPHNYIVYKAAFNEDICLACEDDILEGDPIGYTIDPKDHNNLTGRHPSERTGPFCWDCLKDRMIPMVLTKRK